MSLLAGVVTLFISLVCFWSAAYCLRMRKRVLGWPSVRGHVTFRAVIQPTNRGRTSSPGWRWAPDVRYQYRVNGVDFQGDKITLPWSAVTSKDKAEALLATIPDEIDVRYDPENPRASCLFAPAISNAIVYGLAGIGVLLLSAMWLLPALMAP